ncbi:sulfite exporter TauE/SafE family protein [Peptococcaceae bacterium 1198_IL3148]
MYLNYDSAVIFINPYIILLIGFSIGILGAYFGSASMFLTVPAMNIFGVPMVFAIGSDLAHVCGKTLFSSRHNKFFNWQLTAILSISGAIGIYLSYNLIVFLEQYHIADTVIRSLYIALLIISGVVILIRQSVVSNNLQLLPKISTVKIPPIIELNPVIKVTLWIPVLLGTVFGLLTGLIGGGSLMVQIPLLTYFLGLPVPMALTSSFITVLTTSIIGIKLWSSSSFISIIITVLLLIGVVVGSQLGYAASKTIPKHKFSTQTKETLLIMSGAKTSLALVLLMIGWVKFAKLLIVAALLPPAVVTIIFLLLEKFVISNEIYHAEKLKPDKNMQNSIIEPSSTKTD